MRRLCPHASRIEELYLVMYAVSKGSDVESAGLRRLGDDSVDMLVYMVG